MDNFSLNQIKIGPVSFDFSTLTSTHQELINSWFLSLMPNEVVFPSQRSELGHKILQLFDNWLLHQGPKKYRHEHYEFAHLKGWLFYSSHKDRLIGQSGMLSFTRTDLQLSSRVNNGYRITGGFWLYQRKDGNPDRRYKNNYYTYYYLSRNLIIKVGSKTLISLTLYKDNDLSRWESMEQQALTHKRDSIDPNLFKEHLPRIELTVVREKMIRYCKYPSWVPNIIKESSTYQPINSIWNPNFDEKIEAFRKSLIGNASLEFTPEEGFQFDATSQMIVGYDAAFGLSVAIPQRIQGVLVKVIGAYAFYKKHLLFITFPDTVEEIQEFACANNHLKKVTLPNRLEILHPTAVAKNPVKLIAYFGKKEEILSQLKSNPTKTIVMEELNESNS